MARAKENIGEVERLSPESLSVRMEPKGMKELNRPSKKHSPRSHKHARAEKRSRKR